MTDRAALVLAIETLERQRHILGDGAIDLAVGPLRAKLATVADGATVEALIPERQSERKVVTVLFADLVGFSAMSERLDSEAVVEIVNALFDRLVPVIEHYGGTIDKFIGDEIMAVFGAPQTDEHHIDHALRAALGMFEALAKYNRDRALALALHVGINTGSVIAGEVGSVARSDYSVTGDTVNVASRLQGAARSGQILVGPSTYRHANTTFEFDAPAALSLKGKSSPVLVYRLIGIKRRKTRATVDSIDLAFAGRVEELDRLLGRAALTFKGSRGCVGIVAEPGVGKSRLLAEFHDRMDANVRWVEASAYDYRSEVSYAVVHELLDGVVGVEHLADRDEVSAAYGDFFETLASAQADEIRPYLFRLRGLASEDVSAASLGEIAPAVLRERMADAAAEFISAATAGCPTVLCIEDLHWADTSSTSLIRALAVHSRLTHVLIVFTTRPDPSLAREWIEHLKEAGDPHSVVELRPLSDAVVSAILDQVFGSDEASLTLRQQIRLKAQGNPFYLVSFVRSLLEEGVATSIDGRITLRGVTHDLSVPESLHAAVGSRIDKLPPRAKEVLRWSAVLGSIFRPAHVERIAHAVRGAADLDPAFSLLGDRRLLRHEPDGRMRFVHAVVQDVAYDSMLERDRRRLHGIVAGIIEQDLSDASEADVALLAWHHERAGDRSTASARYEQAATLAANTFANQEVVKYLESALQLADREDTSRMNKLIEWLGDVLQVSGRFAAAAERFESIGALSADSLDNARIRRKIAKTLTSRQQFDQANRAIVEAREMLERIQHSTSDDSWLREHFALELFAMWSAYIQSRLSELAALASRIRPQIERHATLAERGIFHRSVALLELRQTRYHPTESTVALAALATDELRRAGDLPEVPLASFTHAFALLWSGAVEKADERLLDVLRETTRLGDAERHMLCLTYLAVTARMLHDIERAEAFAHAAKSAAHRNRSAHYEGVAHSNLAWVAWRRGNGASADEHVASARRMLVLPGYPFNWLFAEVGLARALDQSDLRTATEYAREMAHPSQQNLRNGAQEALESAIANPTEQALVELLAVSVRAGYA